MAELRDDIAAYEEIRADLEARDLGKWVVVQDRHLVNVFPSFEDAAREAVRKFGRGPYLIRQIGAGAMTLSAAAMYNPAHAKSPMRV